MSATPAPAISLETGADVHARPRADDWADGRSLGARRLIAVGLFAATLLLPTLGSQRVLTKHEVFAAEPAREMLYGGQWVNWIIPHFAGVPRVVKPPTAGWLIAGSMALFHSQAEWVVRLPSALSAVLLVLLMADLTSHWLGRRAGVIAGLLQATFVYVLMQGRLAEADMPMGAAVCLAMYALARGVVRPWGQPRPSRWLGTLFYAGAGMSFLFKGVGVVFILAALIAFVIVSVIEKRGLRDIGRFLLNPLGLALFLAMLCAWPIAAWRADPAIVHAWRREIFGRMSGEFGERQPWYFYAIAAPAMLLPWLPFAVGGLIEGIRRRVHRGAAGQFLLCWFFPGIIILSFSAWKHHHYTIPMLPAATPAAAAGVCLWLGEIERSRRRREAQGSKNSARALLGAAVWLAGCTLAAALLWRFLRVARVELAIAVELLGVGGGFVVYVVGRGWADASERGLFATAWVIAFFVGLVVMPAFEEYHWSAELAMRADREVPPGQPIYLLGLGEHNAAFYLRLPLRRIDKKADVIDWLERSAPSDAYALCAASLLPTLREDAQVTELDRAAHLRAKLEKPGELAVLVRLRRRSAPVGG